MENSSLSAMLLKVQSLADQVVVIAKDGGFYDYALVVGKVVLLLHELSSSCNYGGLSDAPEIWTAMESLGGGLNRARVLLTSEFKGREDEEEMVELTQDMRRSLELVSLTCVDLDDEVKERIKELRNEMLTMMAVAVPDRRSGEFGIQTGQEIERAEAGVTRVEDVVMQIKNGGLGSGVEEEDLMLALWALNDFIKDRAVEHSWIQDENVVEILLNRLSLVKSSNVRCMIIKILRTLVAEHPDHKERMVDVGSLSRLVKSLAREAGERREAVGLLSVLSDVPAARRRIGKIQGCIVMVVSMLNGDDLAASNHSLNLLNALSSNTQNALHMAEAGYFSPLVHHLTEGSDMSKILMATALSRIELTDQNKAKLGQEGAMEPLAGMFNNGKMEAKLSALKALHTLSTHSENVRRLVNSGIVLPLLQLLFSVTSVAMTLREPAAAILARIAQSESVLVNRDVAQQMLSLLGLSSPSIKYHLLHALNSISTHSKAARVRKKMIESGAFHLLMPFLSEPNNDIRAAAVNLLYTLSKYFPVESTEQLDEAYLVKIIGTVSSSSSEEEKAAAIGILSNVPVSDKKATEALLRANAVPILVSMLDSSMAWSSSPMKSWIADSITHILIRFTAPSNKKLQRHSAQNGVIPLLVKLLCNESSIMAKSRAATSLAQLSQSSVSLRKPRKFKWACAAPFKDSFCEVHDGYCHVKSTFCLIKANAVRPLLQILDSRETEADAAVLGAISTLLQDEICESGSNYIAESSGIGSIVKVMESGSVKVQEKCLWILERVFRFEKHRKLYGEVAEGVLIDLAQKGDAKLKPVVAKILAQLELLQMQSSFF